MGEYIVKESGYPGKLKQEIVGKLVRCKDCKYGDKGRTLVVCGIYLEGHPKYPDDYCSEGESIYG